MRTFYLGVAALLISGITLAGTLPPVTVKEINLMLRAGYSLQTVERELAARHLMGSLADGDDAALLRVGASREFIVKIQAGAFAVPTKEIAAAQSKIAADDARHASEAERSRAEDSVYREQLLRTRSAPAALPVVHPVALAAKGDLINMHDGKAAHFDDESLAQKKLIALYFSAHWCGPCRKFTPELVQFYNRVAPQHPEFEVVFVSADRSQNAMEDYMRVAQMPWPALEFAKIGGKAELRKYAGPGIPCLVVIDANGRVLSDSYVGGEYRGPRQVLADLDNMFTASQSAQVALTH